MHPETILDRYLRSYEVPLEIRRRYPGKQDIDRLEPEALSFILGHVHYAINQRYREHKDQIHTPAGPIEVHLDFTSTPEEPKNVENALSFTHQGYAFLLLTVPIIRRMLIICEEIGLSPAIFDLLHLTVPTTTSKADFIAILFLVQMQFVSNHELGHHFHGHCAADRKAFIQEFDDSSAIAGGDKLRQQAMEVDADGYAVHSQLNQLILEDMGTALFTKLAPEGISKDMFLLNLLFVSIASYMFLKPQPSVSSSEFIERDHPPELVRMNVIMRDIEGWCSALRPELLGWAGVDHFQKMMAAIETCQSESLSSKFWREQGRFLESDAGRQYMDSLYERRVVLRGEMAPYVWTLLPRVSARAE
jgi:hypothetical protein